MYGIYYIKKNISNNILLFFRNNRHEDFEIKISSWSKVSNFDQSLINEMKNFTTSGFIKPYEVFYRNLKDNFSLNKTIKELALIKDQLDHPLIDIKKVNPYLVL